MKLFLKLNFIFYFLILFVFSNYAQNFEWAKGIGGRGMERAWDMTITAQKELIVTGQFSDTLIVDTMQFVSKGNSDVFVCKLNNNGKVQWVQTFGGATEDIGIAITADNNGNCYVTGYFTDNMVILGDTLVARGWDIFVVKILANGAMQWCRHIKGEGSEIGYGIALHADNAIYVTGWYQNTLSFNSGEILGNYGGSDVLLFKLNSDGVAQWAEHAGNQGVDYGYKTSVNPVNGIFVTGVASNKSRFSGVYNTGDGVYVAKYNTNGLIQWVKSVGYAPATGVNDIVADEKGGTCITGRLAGAGYFDSTVLHSFNNTNDPYMAYCNNAGNWKWAVSLDGSGNDKGRAVTFKNHNFYSTGTFDTDLYMGDDTLISAGSDDIYILQLDSLGNMGWWLQAGGTQSDVVTDIIADDSGNVYISGWYIGNSYFGAHQLTAQHGGDMNFFVAKANPNLLNIKSNYKSSASFEIEAFPNPATNLITIRWQNKFKSDALVLLEITDVSGKVIFQKQIVNSKNEVQIPLSAWNSGVYMCNLLCGNEHGKIRFIVKNNSGKVMIVR